MRYYVVSDVHVFYTPLVAALDGAGFYEDAGTHKLLILGDLFDRGSEAVKLQEFVLELMEQDAVILIRGNHEDLFEALVTEDGGQPYSYHVSKGTYDNRICIQVLLCALESTTSLPTCRGLKPDYGPGFVDIATTPLPTCRGVIFCPCDYRTIERMLLNRATDFLLFRHLDIKKPLVAVVTTSGLICFVFNFREYRYLKL